MDQALFERLLYEEESTTLDFKKEQYQFAKAGDDEKSELLKDIVGFANAWRRSEAYILIGVDEVRGGRSNVVGIAKTDHLDDHSLQQFVNSLTNRPVRFGYEAFGFEGKQVGIVRIEEQLRPIYLKRDYGKLEKEKVYVRRGSSTNPNKPASLEEIAQMGQGTIQQTAEVVVEFAEIERDNSLGSAISWNAELVEMPPLKTIPDLPEERRGSPSWGFQSLSGEYVNRNFYRELADYEYAKRWLHPVRLVAKNIGQVSASNVQMELIIPMNSGLVGKYASDLPAYPKSRFSKYKSDALLGNIQRISRRNPGDVIINKNDDCFRIEINCGDLQPGRWVWSDRFYLGKAVTGEAAISGRIFAGNLPQPKDFVLTISVDVTQMSMTVSDLLSLPKERRNKSEKRSDTSDVPG
jgi:hypothetical protein